MLASLQLGHGAHAELAANNVLVDRPKHERCVDVDCYETTYTWSQRPGAFVERMETATHGTPQAPLPPSIQLRLPLEGEGDDQANPPGF